MLLEEAIADLEENHSRQIREDGLHRLLAKAYFLQSKYDKALAHAERAVALKPESCAERSMLGEILSGLGSHDWALAEHEAALSFEPGEEALLRIADIYQSQVIGSHSPEIYQQHLDRAITVLLRAIATMEGRSLPLDPAGRLKQIRARSKAHIRLGTLYRNQRKYDQASYHLKIAAAYSECDEDGALEAIESRRRLGMAFLRARAYEEADETFRKAAEQAERLLKAIVTPDPADSAQTVNGSPDTVVMPHPVRVQHELIFVLNWRAFGLVLREIGSTQAKRLIRRAEDLMPGADQKCLSTYKAQRDLILGLIDLNAGRAGKAINRFQQALEQIPDAEGSFFLARAYAARAAEDIAHRASTWIELARRQCRLAAETDWREEQREQIDVLNKQLDILEDLAKQPHTPKDLLTNGQSEANH